MSTKLVAVVVAGGLAAPLAASADDVVVVDTDADEGRVDMYSYAWSEPRLASTIGIGVTVGGGINGFTDSLLRDTVDTTVGGAWALRATFGTHIPLGLDVSYTGTSVDLRPLGQSATGQLLGTNIEGALRWNILPHFEVNPYVFAGIGWQRYDLRDVNFSQADAGIADQDDVAVFPMGAGLSYRDTSGITFDARGTFRPATESNLIVDDTGGFAEVHSWEASGNIGYEF